MLEIILFQSQLKQINFIKSVYETIRETQTGYLMILNKLFFKGGIMALWLFLKNPHLLETHTEVFMCMLM